MVKKKRYTRREAIKLGAKATAGAAIGGTIGHFAGRGYKTVRDFYREDIDPYIRKGKKIMDKTEETKDKTKKFVDKYLLRKEVPVTEEEVVEPKKEISRRGFLRKMLGYAHEHPISSGTAIGATSGAGLSGLVFIPGYLRKKQIAKLKDTNTEYGERIGILESYKNKLEEDIINIKEGYSQQEAEIDDLKKELTILRKVLGKEKGLEKKVIEPEGHNTLLIIGLIGIILAIILSSLNLTGFYILENSIEVYLGSGLIFVFSLILIFLGSNKKNH